MKAENADTFDQPSERIQMDVRESSSRVCSTSVLKDGIHLDEAANYLEDSAFSLRRKADKLRSNWWERRFILQRAEDEYNARRKRAVVFDDTVLAQGPAWDIMLDLFISESAGRPVSITDATVAACCPPTTALRYLRILSEAGLIDRIGDEADLRRTHIKLNDNGRNKIEASLSK